jgi:hypothetical protein
MSNLKFGKLTPRHDDRTLMFSKYLTAALPPILPEYSNIAIVEKNIKISDVKKLYPMDGNDQFGCCTMAGAAHITTTYNGLIGKKKIPTRSQVLSIYKKLTGGQDTGLVMLDALNYWRKTGLFGEQISAFAKINPKNHDHVKLAIQLFGGIYLGFNVQENAIKDFQSNTPWTPGKLTGDGHCVVIEDCNQSGVEVLTWGGVILATWDWIDYCVDEMYVALPKQASDPKFKPGYNLLQLQADLTAITN